MVHPNCIVLSNPCGFHHQRIPIICMYGVSIPRMGTLLPLLQETEPEDSNRGDLVWQRYSRKNLDIINQMITFEQLNFIL